MPTFDINMQLVRASPLSDGRQTGSEQIQRTNVEFKNVQAVMSELASMKFLNDEWDRLTLNIQKR